MQQIIWCNVKATKFFPRLKKYTRIYPEKRHLFCQRGGLISSPSSSRAYRSTLLGSSCTASWDCRFNEKLISHSNVYGPAATSARRAVCFRHTIYTVCIIVNFTSFPRLFCLLLVPVLGLFSYFLVAACSSSSHIKKNKVLCKVPMYV